MKPQYPYQPYQQVQTGRAEAVLMGVGVTLLAMSLLGATNLVARLCPLVVWAVLPGARVRHAATPRADLFRGDARDGVRGWSHLLALARRRALPHPSPGPGPHHRRHRRAQPLPHHRLCDLARMRRLVRRSVGATARGKYAANEADSVDVGAKLEASAARVRL